MSHSTVCLPRPPALRDGPKLQGEEKSANSAPAAEHDLSQSCYSEKGGFVDPAIETSDPSDRQHAVSDTSSNLSIASATTHQSKDRSLDIHEPSLVMILAFCALCLCIFLVALDTVLIPTALPNIFQSFHIPDSLYAWVGSAYLLANAASVPLWGRISDVFGRKSVILIANVIFLGGSILSAVSTSAIMLVAGRAVQGLGGGGIVVLVHICASDMFSIRDRSLYIGILGAIWAVASALGPVLGGIFAEKLDWRWCFYIDIPIVTVSTITIYFTLDLHNPKTPLLAGLASIDWLGTLTILTATILLLVGLQLGGTGSYRDITVVALLTFGSLAFIAFPITQWRVGSTGGSPIMPMRIFKDVSNLSALSVCSCDALVFNSVTYFLPLYFQVVLSKSPSIAGVYMLAIAVPLAAISFASGLVIEMTGRFLEVLQGGLFLMTVGVGLLISLDTSPGLGKTIGILMVIGLGFGPNFGAPLIALQTRIRASDIATGTAAFGFVRMISGAIGLVVGQVIFQYLMISRLEGLVDSGISGETAQALSGGAYISVTTDVAQLPSSLGAVIRASFMSALRGAWILYTVIAGLGLLVSFGIKRTKLHRVDTCTDFEDATVTETVCPRDSKEPTQVLKQLGTCSSQ